MTVEDNLRAVLAECMSALSWDHFYDADATCGGCSAFTAACKALGISAEEAAEL